MKGTLFLLLLLVQQCIFSQRAYWQQQVNYKIDVRLDVHSHMLEARMQMHYFNNSPDSLDFLWIHCWPNAYNNQSALAKQLGGAITSGRLRQGYIDQFEFIANGKKLSTTTHPQHTDILKLELDEPLLPGASILINTPFRVKLPVYYSRSGHFGDQYMITQWYPKPAVYDHKGWHPMPYLERGEFYSEFGSFDVTIHVPAPYVVAATGVLQTPDEAAIYKKIGRENISSTGLKNKYRTIKKDEYKTLHFQADSVHDFAWFADKDFIIRYDTLQLETTVIDVFSFAKKNGNDNWHQSIKFLKDAVGKFSDWIGEYPYPVVAAVEGPANERTAGMEYPMITLITTPNASEKQLDAVIAHEVGHNWFYGILASNERLHPWMDEGMNSYFQFRYEAEKYRWNSHLPNISEKMVTSTGDEFLLNVLFEINKWPLKVPVETPSSSFSDMRSYLTTVYLKAAVWMGILEASIGKDEFRKAIMVYYSQWKFRHPYPEDFRRSIEETTKKTVQELFALLQKNGNFR